MISGVKIKTTFLFLLIILIPLKAQWVKTASLLTSTITKVDYVYCFAQGSITQSGSTTNYQYAGTSAGIYISADYGASWTNFKDGLTSSDPSILSISPWSSGIFAGGYGGLYYSTSHGVKWTSIANYNNGFTVPAVTSITVNGLNILASSISAGVFRSTNAGSSWTAVNNGLTTSTSTLPWIYSLLLVTNGQSVYIYAATGNGVYLTADNGNTWYSKSTGMLTGTIVYSLIANGTTLLAGTSGGLYKSINMGNSWYQVSGAPAYTFNSFAKYNTAIFGGTSYGVYLSKDNGATWSDVSSGLSSTDALSVSVMGSYLMAGTYQGGIWRRPLSQMVTVTSTQTEEVPADFTLGQNYPNPFNPSTTIKYSVPASYGGIQQHVTLKIFDVLGRDITTLVDENQSPGTYTVSFSAEKHLPGSGIYFYTLRSGSYSLTKKMLLLK
jgi:hypothetical protein